MPRQTLDVFAALTELRIDYLPRAAMSLLRLRLTLKLLGLSWLFPELLAGVPTRTLDANSGLAALATRTRADHTLHRHFAQLDAHDLAAQVQGAAEFQSFRAALGDFLDEYGHRETGSPLLLSSPTWKEALPVVLGAIKALVDARAEGRGQNRLRHAMRRLLGHPVVRRSGTRESMMRIIDAARAASAFREDTHLHGTKVLPILRHSSLEMSHRLTHIGALRNPDELFHLRLEELEALSEPATMPTGDIARIHRTVRIRSARRHELSGVPLISTAALFPDPGTDDATIVAGAAAGGGRASGPVRVIREPAEFGRLHNGEILVCPYTNPAWTPLFRSAAAVVPSASDSMGSFEAVHRALGEALVWATLYAKNGKVVSERPAAVEDVVERRHALLRAAERG